MNISSRDKIALLIAGVSGVAFCFLAQFAGYGSAVVTVPYAVAIIPFVISRADQRKLLVWQVCILSFTAALVARDSLSNPKEALEVAFVFWIFGSLLSSPLPLFIYWQRVKERKFKWVRFFLIGGLYLAVIFSRDPFLVLGLELTWTLCWLATFVWEWRTEPTNDVPRKSALVALTAFVLLASVLVLTVVSFRNQAFHLAMDRRDYRIARCLGAVGADVNGLDRFGETALGAAAWNGDADGVNVLLSMGAKVDLEQKGQFQGLSPSGTALAIAASSGRLEICKSLLAAGADVNKKNQHGMTPFLVALGRGDIQCASTMLDYGADVNARDALGQTPLMLLRQFDTNDPTAHHVLDELLAKGADVTVTDDKGQTAEDWALLYHRQELAERLHKIGLSNTEK
jgi:Ankyrin repeats (3 copies)